MLLSSLDPDLFYNLTRYPPTPPPKDHIWPVPQCKAKKNPPLPVTSIPKKRTRRHLQLVFKKPKETASTSGVEAYNVLKRKAETLKRTRGKEGKLITLDETSVLTMALKSEEGLGEYVLVCSSPRHCLDIPSPTLSDPEVIGENQGELRKKPAQAENQFPRSSTPPRRVFRELNLDAFLPLPSPSPVKSLMRPPNHRNNSSRTMNIVTAPAITPRATLQPSPARFQNISFTSPSSTSSLLARSNFASSLIESLDRTIVELGEAIDSLGDVGLSVGKEEKKNFPLDEGVQCAKDTWFDNGETKPLFCTSTKTRETIPLSRDRPSRPRPRSGDKSKPASEPSLYALTSLISLLEIKNDDLDTSSSSPHRAHRVLASRKYIDSITSGATTRPRFC